ncbi:NUDIX domain-containing protein [Nocardia otitidiscaviarum]|uniref:NUDIX hydrolase n=1 Tax=Nocardia otitidiscaviarum TaxID=1823 RepID=UPI001892FC8D|nr:NUDIX domain-containing protein [Nocardia otitidiscaviarum]MBF6236648.1 NUDIX domain-containing protein [Nocardia otitidiscaviarum]
MTRTDYFHDPNAPTPNSIKVAVSALVRDESGRILMIHRTDNDMYSIPGGGLEAGETVSEAVVREVKEETGIDVDIVKMIGVFSNPDHVIAYDDGEVRQEFSICFIAKPTGGELRTSSESKDVKWVAVENLSDLDIHPSIRLRISQGLEDRNGPYFT